MGSRIIRRCSEALATGLAAAGLLGLVDAGAYLLIRPFMGIGDAEFAGVLSLSLLLSASIYGPATLLLALLALPMGGLRAPGRIDAVQWTAILWAALLFTNAARLVSATFVGLSVPDVASGRWPLADSMRHSPLILLLATGIAALVGRALLRRPTLFVSPGAARARRAAALLVLAALVASTLVQARFEAFEDASAATAPTAPGPNRPHVVILLLDTVRADALSVYGAPPGSTPHIQRLADRGVVFERALSPGAWTLPAHASLFTGLAASEHGVNWGNLYLEDRFTTLAEHLRGAGYRTVSISSNTMLNRPNNLFQGFDEVHRAERQLQALAFLGSMELLEWLSGRPLESWFPGPWAEYLTDRGAQRATQLAITALDEAAASGRPLFLFVNFIEAHLPFTPPRPYRRGLEAQERRASYLLDFSYSERVWPYVIAGEESFDDRDLALMRRLYQASVRYLDDRVGEIVTAVDSLGLGGDTLLVLTSDHGENIGDHGLLDHQFSLHETLTAVPLVVRFEDRVKPLRVSEPVQTTDIFPTILEVAGIDHASNPAVARALPLANAAAPGRPVVAEYNEPDFGPLLHFQTRVVPGGYNRFLRRLRSIESDGYKLIWSSDGLHELYHLDADPAETRNLIDLEPERAAHLQAQLDRWLAGIETYRPHPYEGPGIELPTEMQQQLRRLGYLP